MKNSNIWLVFSWWWVNWFVYVWVIKYLQEKWITPKVVWWTSVWSVFASLVSAWYTWEELYEYSLNLEKRIKTIKDVNWWSISKSTLKFDFNNTNWLLKWEKIYNEIKTLLENKNIKTFSDLKIPYYLHIVNINTWKDYCVDSLDKNNKDKNLIDYIRASISIPWIFKPHEIDWEYYVDGWLKSNYPILSSAKICKNNDIVLDKIVNISIMEDFSRHDNYQNESFIEILLRSISISIQDQYESDTKLFKERHQDIELVNIEIKKIFKNSLLTAKISQAIDYWYNEIKKHLEN